MSDRTFLYDERRDLIVFIEDGSTAAQIAEEVSLETAYRMAAADELFQALIALVEAFHNREATAHPALVEQAEAAIAQARVVV
ncbi:hypothetical protein [Sphingomonas sp. ID0503]|uniref:hypothetical protein n=1 Tax=Sphingomonas sp. ID0503 TaxID=3399691 RepID=UPI003AFAB64A